MINSLIKNNDAVFSAYIKSNFFSLRIGAEQVARNTYCRNGIEDVTLEQIYDVLVKEHLITEEQAEAVYLHTASPLATLTL